MSMHSVRPEERIARAIMAPEWDERQNRISPSAFTAENLSVNRLAIFPLSLTSQIFLRDFNKPPRDAVLAAVISVSKIEQAGKAWKSKPTSLSVTSAPRAGNEAHAEVVGRITRGLANQIIQELEQRHPLPTSKLALAWPAMHRIVVWIWRKFAILSYSIRRT